MEAYDDGWKAYFDNVENPYEVGSIDYQDFEHGHFDAMQWAERFAA